jgi:hypothetical protein
VKSANEISKSLFMFTNFDILSDLREELPMYQFLGRLFVGVGIVQFEAKFNLEGKVILQNTTKLKN